MSDNKRKGKDFFMHVGLMVSLYAGAVALLAILFKIINTLYPQVGDYFGVSTSSISFPVATLLVFFPIFLLLANILNKGYASDPARKEYTVRHWLIYITLFVAGLVIASDLVTLLYFFLDGRDITVGFLLKVTAVGVVGGSVFGYFLDDLRNKLTGQRRTIWRVVAIVLVVGAIIGGFVIIGTPKQQRLMRYDNQMISDLQQIQYGVVEYWQTKEVLPESLDDLKDPLSSYDYLPRTSNGGEYIYRTTGDMTFELCADFNLASRDVAVESQVRYPGGFLSENWQHDKGEHCFERTIDPDRYPKFRD